MMMGPAPMMRMLSRSVRFGISLPRISASRRCGRASWPAVRLTIRYMKCSNSSRRSCGPGLASGCPWKLKAGRSVRSRPCSEPSNSERWVARSVARQGRLVDREAMVLARDQHAAGVEFRHRVIGAVMAELHLHGLRAAREPEQLVAEADAEHRDVGRQESRDRRRWRNRRARDHPDHYLRKYHQDSSQALDLP